MTIRAGRREPLIPLYDSASAPLSAPDNLRLDDQLCFALYAATNAITRTYRPMLERIGLTYPQYLVMMVLWEDDGCPTRHIADRLALAGNAVSPLLDRLAASGLLTREHDLGDRRVTRVQLTETGRDLRHAASQVQSAVACDTRLTPPQLGALRDELHLLSDTLAASGGSPA